MFDGITLPAPSLTQIGDEVFRVFEANGKALTQMVRGELRRVAPALADDRLPPGDAESESQLPELF